MAGAPRPAVGGPRWHGSPHGQLRLRSWSGEAGVVYDTRSGDTHCFDALPYELLCLLQDGPPLTSEALLAALAEVLEQPVGESARRGVEEGLKILQDRGLVFAHEV